MAVKGQYSILYEAYEHYRKTGDNHFIVLPKNPDYLLTVLNSIPDMLERGFITNASANLLDANGIHFIESRRE